MKGTGSTSFQLDSGNSLKMSDILFVPSLTRNLVSILTLEDKGYRVAFIDGKVLFWHKASSLDKASVIGVRYDSLYKLIGRSAHALVHDDTHLSELWHRRIARLHYKALPSVRKMVTSFPELQIEHDGVCKGCALGKLAKSSFPNRESKSKGILDLVHLDLCGLISVASLRGFWYYILFIDNYSWKTWIYFSKSKDSGEVLADSENTRCT